jgi:hypothetical protein
LALLLKILIELLPAVSEIGMAGLVAGVVPLVPVSGTSTAAPPLTLTKNDRRRVKVDQAGGVCARR